MNPPIAFVATDHRIDVILVSAVDFQTHRTERTLTKQLGTPVTMNLQELRLTFVFRFRVFSFPTSVGPFRNWVHVETGRTLAASGANPTTFGDFFETNAVAVVATIAVIAEDHLFFVVWG